MKQMKKVLCAALALLIDSFVAKADTPDYREGMDFTDVQPALDCLITQVAQALTAQKPGFLIEFRQNYISPNMRKYGNMFRVSDCPNSALRNRIGIAAPMLCGILDTSLRALRDEPGFWWMTYRAAWKQNVKSALLPGAIFGAAMSAVIFSLYFTDLHTMSDSAIIFSIIGILLFISMILLVLVQIPLMQLTFFQMVRNALMVFIRLTGKTLLASLLIAVYYILATGFFPSSLLPLMILNTWFPVLLSLMLLYKDLDAIFQIESRKSAQ